MTDAFDHPEDAIGGHSEPLEIAGHGCDYEAHSNPYCTCNTTDAERRSFAEEYLNAIREVAPHALLMPLDNRGKRPKIYSLGADLLNDERRLTNDARRLLHGQKEALKAIEDGHRGFCLYAGNDEMRTEGMAFTDHDDPERWNPDSLPSTLTVMSGSGGYHLTYRNDGNVDNAKGKGEMAGAGEVRAENWYVVIPGSVHPSGGIYHIVNNQSVATLTSDDLPTELLPAGSSGTTSGTPPEDQFDFAAEDIEALPDDFDANAVENDVGVSLATVRGMSEKLDRLLNPPTTGYPSPSEADQACVSSLLYWRFEESDIADILRACRARQKLNRDEYVAETIRKTSLTEVNPVDPDLLVALAKNASEQNGRSIVSPYVLDQIRFVLQHCEHEATVREIVDTGLIDWWAATNVRSVERRVRRGLKVLEDAGYVSSIPDPRDRRATLWRDEGLNELTLLDW